MTKEVIYEGSRFGRAQKRRIVCLFKLIAPFLRILVHLPERRHHKGVGRCTDAKLEWHSCEIEVKRSCGS